jgi:hypothetical protein
VRAIPSFTCSSCPNVTALPAIVLRVARISNLGLGMGVFFDSSPSSRRNSMKLRRNQPWLYKNAKGERIRHILDSFRHSPLPLECITLSQLRESDQEST